MSSYEETRVDVLEFRDNLRFEGLPLAIDDMSLSFHLGIHNRTMWWLMHTREDENDKFAGYSVFSIDKRGKNKGKRSIQNPKRKLKAVQRLLLSRFLEPFPVGNHIGAYVPGRSCMDTAKQHVGRGLIISMDIKDFFPSVKRSMIRRLFLYAGYNHFVASLLAGLMTYKNFVPQGAPTSGLVANLVADLVFDQAILEDLKGVDPDWLYTRYSDDIDISHPETQPKEKVQEVIDIVRKRLEKANFRVNAKKTRVEPHYRRQKVLGIVVNEKPNLPRYEYDRLRCLIHNCLMHGLHTQFKRAGQTSADGLKSHIRGKISYLKQIDEKKAAQLKEKFDLAVQVHSSDDEEEVYFDAKTK
jgi:retron-type reverse transcriptase